MISKLLKTKALPALYNSQGRTFCQNKDFFENKKLKQI